MKLMKFFDCQWDTPKMPEEVKDKLFDCYEVGNYVCVEFTVGERDGDYNEEDEDSQLGIVSKWLIEQGCELYEEVIIKHWW